MRSASVAAALLVAAGVASGQTWDEIGASAGNDGISGPDHIASYSSVAIDPDGKPTVAWYAQDLAGNRSIRLKRWTNEGWSGLGGSDSSSVISQGSVPQDAFAGSRWLALDAAGNPVVAWQSQDVIDSVVHVRIHVKRWTGQAWAPIGGPGAATAITGAGQARMVNLALDPLQRPVIAWVHSFNGLFCLLHLKRWNGSDWVGEGGSEGGDGISLGVNATWPSLALDAQGRPSVAWSSAGILAILPVGQIYLRRWVNGEWSGVGGSEINNGLSDLPGLNLDPSLALDADGNPAVAWCGRLPGSTTEIYFKQHDGASWIVHDGSGDGDGVSQNQSGYGESWTPTLAVDADGKPLIAWAHRLVPNIGGSTAAEIFLRRWDGSMWGELAGSATAGGISGSSDRPSEIPALARSDAGVLAVAWREREDHSSEYSRILLRRLVPPLPELRNAGQFRLSTGAMIPPGGLTGGDPGFTARAELSSPESASLRLIVEAREIGLPFDGTYTATSAPVPSGQVAEVSITGLPAGGRFRWRARAEGAPWRYFQSHPDNPNETDLWVRANAAPLPEPPQQLDPGSGGILGVGSAFFSAGSLRIRAVVGDSDGDRTRLEVEIRALGESFSGHPTAAAPLGLAGSASVVDIPLPGDGAYRWRHRGADEYGGVSEWEAFGGNGEDEADFIAERFGSVNAGAACPAGASGAGQELFLAAIFLLRAAGGRATRGERRVPR